MIIDRVAGMLVRACPPVCLIVLSCLKHLTLYLDLSPILLNEVNVKFKDQGQSQMLGTKRWITGIGLLSQKGN